MTGIFAYHVDPRVTKSAFVAEMQSHADANRIVKGQYWRNGKGCALGCGVQSILQLQDNRYSIIRGDHQLLAAALGIPLWLAHMEDRMFENLPYDVAMTWPVRFAEAIPDGGDLSDVWRQFAPWMLRTIALPGAGDDADVRAVVERVAVGIETDWSFDNAASAASAAWAARAASAASAAWAAWAARAAAESAESAESAAWAESAESAAWAESAESAAWAERATSAESAASAAAESAESSASAAWAARWGRMSEKLLEIVAASPVVSP